MADELGPVEVWKNILRIHQQHREKGRLDIWVGPTVDEVLQGQGLRADTVSRLRLIEEVDKAFCQAAAHLMKNADGDYRPDPEADRFPEWVPPQTAQQTAPSVPSKPGTVGEILVEEFMRPLGLTQAALAEAMGVFSASM